MTMTLSSRGYPDTFLSQHFPRQLFCFGGQNTDGKVFCTVKKGDFVVQVLNICVASERETILLGNGVTGCLFLSSFNVMKGNHHPHNDTFVKTFFASKLRPSKADISHCAGSSRLWLHLMDGLGFPGKHKGNITVRFELVVVGRTAKDNVALDYSLPGSFKDGGEVVRAVTSSCSLNARHLVWDQKMEMLFGVEVMHTINRNAKKLAAKTQTESIDPLSADNKYYILRASMWQHDFISQRSGGTASDAVLIAAAERNIAEILAPFLPTVSNCRGAVGGSVDASLSAYTHPPVAIRHEVVFPLRLLALPTPGDSTALSNSRHRAGNSDVRLRVGFLLISNEETATCCDEGIPVPPTVDRSMVKSGHVPPPARPRSRGTLEATAESFMNKGGWF